MRKAAVIVGAILAVQIVLMSGCTTGVESSPRPGILRVTMKSNETDTLLVILSDTIRFSKWDHYDVIASQGRIYNGGNYVDLYTNTSLDRVGADTINLLQRQWLDGRLILDSDPIADVGAWESRYVGSAVFEWYVPPGAYDKLEFGLRGIEVYVARPRQFRNPLQLPEGVSALMSLGRTINVEEGRVTQIDLEVYPFQSIRRYKDAYLFDRKVSIARVQIY